MIRPLVPEDTGEVCRLRQRAFDESASADPTDLREHFEQVFFDNPWSDGGLDSLVLEQEGSITGFLGLVPRPLTYRGRRLQGVVQTQLMVDPERAEALAAVRLLKKLFSLDYDLAIADGATPQVAELWERCGGTRLWLHSFEWIRSLRPGREFAEWLGDRREGLRPLLWTSMPLLTAADTVFARVPPNHFHRQTGEFRAKPITANRIVQGIAELFGSSSLRMSYDEESVVWLLERLQEKKRFGDLHGSVLYDGNESIVGWYLYLTNGKRSAAWVVQVAARRDARETVLSRLFEDAWAKGAYAVRGTMDTELAVPVEELHGRFNVGAPWTLCHSPHSELLNALRDGDAKLNRLDMEFWMRFTGG